MRVVGFITQPAVIKRILDHLPKRELWAGLLTVAAVVLTA